MLGRNSAPEVQPVRARRPRGDPTASALREIAEELGVRLDPAALEPGGTMFRLSLVPRVDLFFLAHTWAGTPQFREPHKCTELVRADPDDLPGDAVDFIGAAITGARTGWQFQEYGWQPAAV
jgi:8-oxo-dGTP pyrophosphatase MutT (NUDIX family)